MGSAEEAARFKTKYRSPHPFISDPQQHLYRDLGFPRGTLSQLLGPRVAAKALRVMLQGYGQGRPTADARQLGGAALVEQDGRIAWIRKGKDAAEFISRKEVLSLFGSPENEP